jgi:diketogulonate reductase-like aldo/keto reductase
LLTANREVLAHAELTAIARRYGRSTTQVIFRFALDVGMICLTGTTDAEHMRNNLDVADFHLGAEDVGRVERMVARQ